MTGTCQRYTWLSLGARAPLLVFRFAQRIFRSFARPSLWLDILKSEMDCCVAVDIDAMTVMSPQYQHAFVNHGLLCTLNQENAPPKRLATSAA